MYQTTGPLDAVHFGIIALFIIPPDIEPGVAPIAADTEVAARASTARPLNAMRIRFLLYGTISRGAKRRSPFRKKAFRRCVRAKRGPPARYSRSFAAAAIAARALASAARNAAAEPLAYAFETSGNATLA